MKHAQTAIAYREMYTQTFRDALADKAEELARKCCAGQPDYTSCEVEECDVTEATQMSPFKEVLQ
jgi:hypothetical protein